MDDHTALADQTHDLARRYRDAVLRSRRLTDAECLAVQASVEEMQRVLETALLHAERAADSVAVPELEGA